MKILIMGYVWPEHSSSAAGFREVNLLDAFQAAGWEVHYSSHAKRNSFAEELLQRGVGVHEFEANDSEFDAWIREMRFDGVIFDRFVTEEQFGWRFEENSPSTFRILDTQDLHFLRRSRQAATQEKREPRFLSDDTLRELAAIHRSDWTWLVSDYEQNLLVTKYRVPPEKLSVFRFFYRDLLESLPFEARDGFVFLGNFRHPPNLDSVFWLKKEIWPEIRKHLPQADLKIYGAYPPKEAMSLHDPENGFQVLGWIENHLKILSQARVCLTPLRFGAGIKGKISDSWSVGTPVLTTPIGEEGMTGGLPFGGTVVEGGAVRIALAAVSLYSDASEWNQASIRGQAIIREHYLFEREAPRMTSEILARKSKLEDFRAQDIEGAMLRLHQHRSTKYLSRWIEAKNQLLRK